MKYVQSVEFDQPFADVCQRVEAAFQEQGFGVLTTIDVDQVLQRKLGKEMPSYRIYGVCNPGLADRALAVDPEVGVLLPCSVTVREQFPGRTAISVLSPSLVQEMAPAPELEQVMADASTRVAAAMAALAPTV
jgi:uncharacterized protein (DUF302 family)